MKPKMLIGLLFAACVGALSPSVTTAEPSASNPVENCDGFYPPALSGVGGTTLFTARMPLSGDLADAVLIGSSGVKELDAAALVCSSHIHISAPTKDGVPVEATWTFRVMWRAPGQGHSYLSTARPAGYPGFCGGYPPAAVRAHAEGRTALAFVIGTDGSVSGLRVTQSSGSKELDDASLACAALWRYFPMTVAGKPIAFDWDSNVNWHLH